MRIKATGCIIKKRGRHSKKGKEEKTIEIQYGNDYDDILIEEDD